MKEHSFFLEVAFKEKHNHLKSIARNFQKSFSDILKNTIELADGNLTNNLLSYNEIVTSNTLEAETQTSILSGSFIDSDITRRELILKSGNINATEKLLNDISKLNNQTLPLIKKLIEFKNSILNSVLSCKMYTTNYPLLITHIMNEAKICHQKRGYL